jgi:hypothetical protein
MRPSPRKRPARDQRGAAEADLVPVRVVEGDLADAVVVGLPRGGLDAASDDGVHHGGEVVDEDRDRAVAAALRLLLEAIDRYSASSHTSSRSWAAKAGSPRRRVQALRDQLDTYWIETDPAPRRSVGACVGDQHEAARRTAAPTDGQAAPSVQRRPGGDVDQVGPQVRYDRVIDIDAPSHVSCTTSSASEAEPSISWATVNSRLRWAANASSLIVTQTPGASCL